MSDSNTQAPAPKGLPKRAMVLAAGFGKRLRPLTLSRPKPLVSVAGRTLIDRTLDRLAAAGVTDVVVNVHYRAEMLAEHLATRTIPAVSLSTEKALLDTGGGVLNALDRLGPDPFLVVNSDMIWRDGLTNTLALMGRQFDPTQMDALLMMQPTITAHGYRGQGDFQMDAVGRLRRRKAPKVAPFLFSGVQILRPEAFEGMAVEPFSLNRIYDKAQEAGRLFGTRHDGDWLDVGTLAGLAFAENELRLSGGREG
ncbi:MAG: nucleotidyltransferase family protein [Minwuia sp.]|nr:nucleotidyltransferase family protein [Minwuia sp.]